AETPPRGVSGRRARIVYRLTPAGRHRLADSLADVDQAAWDDESFTVLFSLFAETTRAAPLQVLELRLPRLVPRRGALRQQLHGAHSRWDRYTVELQRHGLEQLESEIGWLDTLIDAERASGTAVDPTAPTDPEPADPVPPSNEHPG